MVNAIEISVIVPTYNRVDYLLHCLAALQKQTIARPLFEIIVVDDGSTDDTYDRLQPFVSDGTVHYFRQSNSGPARARNVGIRAAKGRILLFIGDDIIATPQLLNEHLSHHRQFGSGDEPIAILGFTDWSDSIAVTPLMKYRGLGQFGYHFIDEGVVDPNNLPFKFFYTSNVSVSRQFLLENDLFFDEDFTHAMGEDGELAYRMQKRGLRIIYNPRALAYHEHPTTFTNVCRRSFLMGQVAVLQVKKHPEWSDLSTLIPTRKGKIRYWTYGVIVQLISPLLKLADDRRWDIYRFGLHKWYDFVFGVHRFEGLMNGLQVYDLDI
jgi:glycosyltransferase involved in cell wall biosynthesis